MRREAATRRHEQAGYATDLTGVEWEALGPLIPNPPPDAPAAEYRLVAVVSRTRVAL